MSRVRRLWDGGVDNGNNDAIWEDKTWFYGEPHNYDYLQADKRWHFLFFYPPGNDGDGADLSQYEYNRICARMIFDPDVAPDVVALFSGLVDEIEV